MKEIGPPVWIQKKIQLTDGQYLLGPNNQYSLSEAAFLHIISGDLSERQICLNGSKKTKKEIILAGGLHTYDGWINFKKNHLDTVHLYHFNSKIHKYWYYARTLKNNVVTLKIPKELFNSKGASITKIPDSYYKSGYLWKTLFPKNKSKDDILSIIDEALYYLNKEESGKGLLIGYALRNHPFTAIKVRIQCQGNIIHSAFPTWEQPKIGNNGKSYSHSDTISFVIASSTEFFDDNNSKMIKSRIYDDVKGLTSLYNSTPKFLLERKRLHTTNNLNEYKKSREDELIALTNNIDNEALNSLQLYLEDVLICKHSFTFQLNIYNELIKNIDSDLKLFNAISFTQNILDILTVFYHYDQTNKSKYFVEAMKYLLLNKTIATGALDHLHNKVIHNNILKFVSSYYNDNIIPQYLDLLAQCPSKSALYTEFDAINSCYKKNLDPLSEEFDIIYNPNQEITLKPEYFNLYLLYLLGENYLLISNPNVRNQLVDSIIESQGIGFKKMVSDFFQISSSKDLEFFPVLFENIGLKIINQKITNVNHNSLSIIIKDYFRTQTAQRVKIMCYKPDLAFFRYSYEAFGTEEYKIYTCLKHERITNVQMLTMFLDNAYQIAQYLTDEDLLSRIDNYKNNVWTERPPLAMLNTIPNYIPHWENQKDKSWMDTPDLKILYL